MPKLTELFRRLLLALLVAATALAGAAPQGASKPADPLDVERARTSRLSTIAAELQQPKADAVALFTEAVRLAGFAVWSEDRAVLAEPTGAPRLRLAVTDAEIRGYCELFRAGHVVQRDDLLAALDTLCASMGLPGVLDAPTRAWLLQGADAADPSARALHLLLDSLGRARAGGAGAITSEPDVALDPLQALLLLRMLSEQVVTPVRRLVAAANAGAADRPKKGPMADDDDDVFALEDLPGWAEDGFVGAVTNVVDNVVKSFGERGVKASDRLGAANAMLSIAKFVLTYTYLRSEIRVEPPGEPLVRRKDTEPGERRTLTARFWIDGSKVTDFLKENRKLVALTGLDIDMPKTGALKGIETEWDIREDRYSSKSHLVVLPAGSFIDLSRVRADDNGEARIQLDGARRPRALDKISVLPVHKKVRIVVTPQVKSVEMQQDVVDAVFGAIGLRSGPAGFLTPVIECLYRMKWRGSVVKDLQILDWIPADVVLQAEVMIEASGAETSRDEAIRMQISRRARFEDVCVQALGSEAPVVIDPEMRKYMPKAVQEQMDEMAAMAQKRWYMVNGPGRLDFTIRDSFFRRSTLDDCTLELGELRQSIVGTTVEEIGATSTFRSGNLTLRVDMATKSAQLEFAAQADAEVVTVSTRKGKSRTTTTRQPETGVFYGLSVAEPWDLNQIETKAEETPTSDPNITNFYGTAAVPFRFGPRAQFAGTAFVTWSLTRRAKTK